MATKEDTTEKGKNVTEQAQEKTGDLASQAEEQVRGQAKQQKERAVGRLSEIAQALHKTSDNLREENQRQIAQYTDKAAGQVERVSGYLHDHSANEIFRETERLARRQPGLFLGGAFALGLLGARFFKSSSGGGSSTSREGARAQGVQSGGQYRERPRRAETVGRTQTREEENVGTASKSSPS